MDMDLKEVIVPTFVSAHLFWIIEKKDLLLRCAINRAIKSKPAKSLNNDEEIVLGAMVCININDKWARAIIEDVIEDTEESTRKFICWLPDYGIVRSAAYVFHLPEGLAFCPPLAKQASLHNIVNLMTDLVLGEDGYEVKTVKTINDVEGVRKVAQDSLDLSTKVFFNATGEDRCNLYGDLVFEFEEGAREPLTDYLISKNLVEVDEDMFQMVEMKRQSVRSSYMKHRINWHQKLDNTEKECLNRIIFNRSKNSIMVSDK